MFFFKIFGLKNYYKILGISQTSSLETIKRAYRTKAKACHPDTNTDKNSKEKFQLLNEAYQVLKNDKKRRLYDYRLNMGYRSQKVYYHQGRRSYHNYKYAQNPYYAHRSAGTSHKNRKLEKAFDNILFLLMLMAGLYAIGFGFYRLYFEKIEGVNPLAGIISGAIFTLVIVFGWILRYRK